MDFFRIFTILFCIGTIETGPIRTIDKSVIREASSKKQASIFLVIPIANYFLREREPQRRGSLNKLQHVSPSVMNKTILELLSAMPLLKSNYRNKDRIGLLLPHYNSITDNNDIPKNNAVRQNYAVPKSYDTPQNNNRDQNHKISRNNNTSDSKRKLKKTIKYKQLPRTIEDFDHEPTVMINHKQELLKDLIYESVNDDCFALKESCIAICLKNHPICPDGNECNCHDFCELSKDCNDKKHEDEDEEQRLKKGFRERDKEESDKYSRIMGIVDDVDSFNKCLIDFQACLGNCFDVPAICTVVDKTGKCSCYNHCSTKYNC